METVTISKATLGALVGVLTAILAYLSGATNVHVAVGPDEAFGAVSSPDINSSYLCVNGACTFYNRQPMKTGTTTICSIKSPSATSTAVTAPMIAMSYSSTTAVTITMASSTNSGATTTSIFSYDLAANKSVYVQASSSKFQAITTANQPVIAPNTWFNVSMTGGTGTFSPVGFCSMDFKVM